MLRPSFVVLALALASAPALAQDPAAGGRCTTPDSIAIRGNTRISDATIRSDAGLTAGVPLNYRAIQRAIQTLFATGEYADVQALCDIAPNGRATLALVVR